MAHTPEEKARLLAEAKKVFDKEPAPSAPTDYYAPPQSKEEKRYVAGYSDPQRAADELARKRVDDAMVVQFGSRGHGTPGLTGKTYAENLAIMNQMRQDYLAQNPEAAQVMQQVAPDTYWLKGSYQSPSAERAAAYKAPAPKTQSAAPSGWDQMTKEQKVSYAQESYGGDVVALGTQGPSVQPVPTGSLTPEQKTKAVKAAQSYFSGGIAKSQVESLLTTMGRTPVPPGYKAAAVAPALAPLVGTPSGWNQMTKEERVAYAQDFYAEGDGKPYWESSGDPAYDSRARRVLGEYESGSITKAEADKYLDDFRSKLTYQEEHKYDTWGGEEGLLAHLERHDLKQAAQEEAASMNLKEAPHGVKSSVVTGDIWALPDQEIRDELSRVANSNDSSAEDRTDARAWLKQLDKESELDPVAIAIKKHNEGVWNALGIASVMHASGMAAGGGGGVIPVSPLPSISKEQMQAAQMLPLTLMQGSSALAGASVIPQAQALALVTPVKFSKAVSVVGKPPRAIPSLGMPMLGTGELGAKIMSGEVVGWPSSPITEVSRGGVGTIGAPTPSWGAEEKAMQQIGGLLGGVSPKATTTYIEHPKAYLMPVERTALKEAGLDVDMLGKSTILGWRQEGIIGAVTEAYQRPYESGGISDVAREIFTFGKAKTASSIPELRAQYAYETQIAETTAREVAKSAYDQAQKQAVSDANAGYNEYVTKYYQGLDATKSKAYSDLARMGVSGKDTVNVVVDGREVSMSANDYLAFAEQSYKSQGLVSKSEYMKGADKVYVTSVNALGQEITTPVTREQFAAQAEKDASRSVVQSLGTEEQYVQARRTTTSPWIMGAEALVPGVSLARSWGDMSWSARLTGIGMEAGMLGLMALPVVGAGARMASTGVRAATGASRVATAARSFGTIGRTMVGSPISALKTIPKTITQPRTALSGSKGFLREAVETTIYPIKHPVATTKAWKDIGTGKVVVGGITPSISYGKVTDTGLAKGTVKVSPSYVREGPVSVGGLKGYTPIQEMAVYGEMGEKPARIFFPTSEVMPEVPSVGGRAVPSGLISEVKYPIRPLRSFGGGSRVAEPIVKPRAGPTLSSGAATKPSTATMTSFQLARLEGFPLASAIPLAPLRTVVYPKVETVSFPVPVRPTIVPITEPVVSPIVEPVPIVSPQVAPVVQPITQPVISPVIEPAIPTPVRVVPRVSPIETPLPVVSPIVIPQPLPIVRPVVSPVVSPIQEPVVVPIRTTRPGIIPDIVPSVVPVPTMWEAVVPVPSPRISLLPEVLPLPFVETRPIVSTFVPTPSIVIPDVLQGRTPFIPPFVPFFPFATPGYGSTREPRPFGMWFHGLWKEPELLFHMPLAAKGIIPEEQMTTVFKKAKVRRYGSKTPSRSTIMKSRYADSESVSAGRAFVSSTV